MPGQHGIEQIKKVALAGAELLNVLSKVIHKHGVFTIFQLSDELMSLGNLDGEALKKELSELDQQERDSLKLAVKEKLVLQNPIMEKKIEDGMDVVDEAINIVVEALKIVEKAKAIVS